MYTKLYFDAPGDGIPFLFVFRPVTDRASPSTSRSLTGSVGGQVKGELPVKVPVFQFRDREAELGFDTFPRFGPAPPPIVQAGKIALAAEATAQTRPI